MYTQFVNDTTQCGIEMLFSRPEQWPTDVELINQSRQFFDHLRNIGTKTAMAIISNDSKPMSTVPIKFGVCRLYFGGMNRSIWTSELRSVDLFSQPPGPELAPSTIDSMICALLDAFPEAKAIRFSALPADCDFYKHIMESAEIRQVAIPYSARGVRECHVTNLPDTWQAYKKLLGSKRRYNFEYRIKHIREHGNGIARLARIDTVPQLDELYRALAKLSVSLEGRDVGGGGETELASLATHKLLLAYVLYCGDIPCAAMLGLKYNHKYYIDSSHSGLISHNLAPGSSALYMATDDLIQLGISRIDFGFGEPKYNYSHLNVVCPRIDLLLMRRTLSNRILRTNHALCQLAVNYLKRKSTKPVQE